MAVDDSTPGTPEGAAEGLRMRYGRLLTDDELGHQAAIDTVDAAVAEVRERLRLHFVENPDHDAVLLLIDGQVVGVAPRTRVMEVVGDAADDGPGSGDGATLPGDPAEFQLIAFRCTQCGEHFFTSYFDLRTNPVCHNRPAELIREPH